MLSTRIAEAVPAHTLSTCGLSFCLKAPRGSAASSHIASYFSCPLPTTSTRTLPTPAPATPLPPTTFALRIPRRRPVLCCFYLSCLRIDRQTRPVPCTTTTSFVDFVSNSHSSTGRLACFPLPLSCLFFSNSPAPSSETVHQQHRDRLFFFFLLFSLEPALDWHWPPAPTNGEPDPHRHPRPAPHPPWPRTHLVSRRDLNSFPPGASPMTPVLPSL